MPTSKTRSPRWRPAAGIGRLALLGAVLVPGSGALAQCGTTVYDTGGAGGNYGNNQNLTWTYCAPPGQMLTLTFTAFNTEAFWDELSVHNGPTNGSPQLGIFSGTTLPPPFTSTVGGCLTLWFTSDFITTAPGWAINITCAVPPPMAGNNCNTATLLPVLPTCTMLPFSNIGATASGTLPAPTCSTPPTTDVWFTFTTGASGQVLIDTQNGSLIDGAMQLYSGTCAALTAVACNDDEDLLGGLLMPQIDRRCATLNPFTTYYIRLWGYGGATGTFGICVSAPAAPAAQQEDCTGAYTICSDQQINNNTNFSGCVADLNASNRGCLMGNERQGTWYFFSPSASGTAALTIQPSANIDYDFAIWGPMATITCPPVGNPVRCSWAYPPNVPGYPGAGAFLTGLGNGAVDNSENEFGNGWVAPLNIIAGQMYIMYIDNFDITGQSFTLDWTLTNGASLDCTVLPVELLGVQATPQAGAVLVSWTTQTEDGTAHFMVERSADAETFAPIGQVPAAGHSLSHLDYQFQDRAPLAGTNYYRLRVVHLDGSVQTSAITSALHDGTGQVLRAVPNPATDHVTVLLPTTHASQVHYRLATAHGKVLLHGTAPLGPGDDRIRLSVATLPDGLYLLRVEDLDGQPLGSTRVALSRPQAGNR